MVSPTSPVMRRMPGLPLVWFGSAAVILGATVVLMFPHRRLWARVERDGGGRVTAKIAAPKERGLPFDYEFRRVADGVQRRLHEGVDAERET